MSNQIQEPTPGANPQPESGPGMRLREAREQAGLSIPEVAARLRLRTTVVEAIEREDMAALGAPVFARGYVDGYVRLLGLPSELVEQLLPRDQVVSTAPLLQSSNRASRGRYMMDRFARRLVYVALTASIVVPVVLLSTSDHLPEPAELLSPLNAPAVAVTDIQPLDEAAPAPPEEVGPPAPPAEQAVMASFTPFYSSARNATSAPVATPTPTVEGLVLEISGDSWVEVIAADGTRLTHDLLRAGARPSFEPGTVSRVLLGNAAAVTVRLNGEKVDISRFQRANVARFAVSSDGSLIPSEG